MHASYKNATWVAPTRAATAASDAATTTPTPNTSTTAATATPAAPAAPEPRQVTIDGVVFVADPRGNKLVRNPTRHAHTEEAPADSAPASGEPAAPAPSAGPLTPRRLSHLGTTYIRTKTGNLVSLAFARKQKELADARRAQMDHKRERLDQLVGVVQSVQGARNSAAAAARGGGGGRGGRRGCVAFFFLPASFVDF